MFGVRIGLVGVVAARRRTAGGGTAGAATAGAWLPDAYAPRAWLWRELARLGGLVFRYQPLVVLPL